MVRVIATLFSPIRDLKERLAHGVGSRDYHVSF